MYEEEKKVIIYVNAEKVTTLENEIRIDEIIGTNIEIGGNEYRLEDIENGSDYCHSEDSYLSLDSETDDEIDIEYEGEFYSYDKCHTPRQPATYFYVRRVHITYIINKIQIKPHLFHKQKI